MRSGQRPVGKTCGAARRPPLPLPRCFAGRCDALVAIRGGSPAAVGVRRVEGDVALAKSCWAARRGENGRRAPFSCHEALGWQSYFLVFPAAPRKWRPSPPPRPREAQLRALSLPALRAELDGALRALSVLKAELGGRSGGDDGHDRRPQLQQRPPSPLGEFALILIKHRDSASRRRRATAPRSTARPSTPRATCRSCAIKFARRPTSTCASPRSRRRCASGSPTRRGAGRSLDGARQRRRRGERRAVARARGGGARLKVGGVSDAVERRPGSVCCTVPRELVRSG